MTFIEILLISLLTGLLVFLLLKGKYMIIVSFVAVIIVVGLINAALSKIDPNFLKELTSSFFIINEELKLDFLFLLILVGIIGAAFIKILARKKSNE